MEPTNLLEKNKKLSTSSQNSAFKKHFIRARKFALISLIVSLFFATGYFIESLMLSKAPPVGPDFSSTDAYLFSQKVERRDGAPALEFPLKNHLLFEYFTIANGLAHDVVYSITGDQSGVLWVGTQMGLNKYDGTLFTNHTGNMSESGSLSDAKVRCIMEDTDGSLWVGTQNGLNRRLKGETDFEVIGGPWESKGILPSQQIGTLEQDQRGTIWIGTRGGLCSWKDGVLSKPLLTGDPKLDYIRDIAFDAEGNLLLATKGGLVLWELHTGTYRVNHEIHSALSLLSKQPMNTVARDSKGRFWLGTRGAGMLLFEPIKNEVTHWSPGTETGQIHPHQVTCFCEDKTGRIWVGTWQEGLFLATPSDSAFNIQCLTSQSNSAHGLSDNRIVSIFEDLTGVLWLGTYNGINKLIPQRLHCSYFSFSDIGPGLNLVRAIYTTTSNMTWIASEGHGLLRINLNTGEHSFFQSDPENKNSISDNRVRGFSADKDGQLWVGTRDGLNIFNSETETFERIPKEGPNGVGGEIRALSTTQDNRLIVAGTNGLFLLNPSNYKLLAHFSHDSKDPNSLSNRVVNSLALSSSHVIWVGTNHGLNRLDLKNGNIIKYLPDRDHGGLCHGQIWSLHETEKGLWVGTGMGLAFMSWPASEQVSPEFETIPGISAAVFGITTREDGIWISTNNGLFRLSHNHKTLWRVPIHPNYRGHLFSPFAFHDDGEHLYVGSSIGLHVINPKTLQAEKPPDSPTILIQNEMIDVPRTLTHQERLNGLTYRTGTGSMHLTFHLADYIQSQRNVFMIRKPGSPHKWTSIKNNEHLSLDNLTPGRHEIEVIAANSDGVWTETSKTLQLSITPHFFDRIAVRLTVFLILALMLQTCITKVSAFIARWHEIRRKQLIGPYRILFPLGSGASGTVYKAIQLNNNKEVALKVMTRSPSMEVSRKRFMKEGLLCERVDHPSVVNILSRGENHGKCWFAMDFLDGITIRELIIANACSWKEAQNFALVMLDVLDAIHRQGIIHRDIKPENLMLIKMDGTDNPHDFLSSDKGTRQALRILDFGIAKDLNQPTETLTGQLLGSFSYMPPESLQTDYTPHRSMDYFALGIILFEMLTRVQPYQNNTMDGLISKLSGKPTRSLAKLRPDLQDNNVRIINLMIEPTLNHRLSEYIDIRTSLENTSVEADTRMQ